MSLSGRLVIPVAEGAMGHRVAAAVLAFVPAGLGASGMPPSARRHPCQGRHECASDHAIYRWRGMFCVKPTSDARTANVRRVVYDGRGC
jgi:hypothetical protein